LRHLCLYPDEVRTRTQGIRPRTRLTQKVTHSRIRSTPRKTGSRTRSIRKRTHSKTQLTNGLTKREIQLSRKPTRSRSRWKAKRVIDHPQPIPQWDFGIRLSSFTPRVRFRRVPPIRRPTVHLVRDPPPIVLSFLAALLSKFSPAAANHGGSCGFLC